MTTKLLEAENLTRRSRDRTLLLDGVSMSLAAGECVVLTGASGSGKTLLLRAIALLDPIDFGQVNWHGNPVGNDDVPRYRRSVIYLQQHAAMIDGTVEENLTLPFRFQSADGARFDRDYVLRGLSAFQRDEAFLHKRAADLSGGERQITALVRALQLEPDLLLLDEPFSATDAATTAAAEQLLADWLSAARDRRAMLLVSHDIESTSWPGIRRLKIQHGRLVE